MSKWLLHQCLIEATERPFLNSPLYSNIRNEVFQLESPLSLQFFSFLAAHFLSMAMAR